MTDSRITLKAQLWEEESYQIGCAFARKEALDRLSALEGELFENRPSGWRVEGWRERTMMTHFGAVRVKRRLYVDSCGRYRFLLDEHLGWEPYRSATPAISESIASLASHIPFREVEVIISKLLCRSAFSKEHPHSGSEARVKGDSRGGGSVEIML